MTKIAILGGGSWGTGLSVVLANSRRSHDITLWVREPAIPCRITAHLREDRRHIRDDDMARLKAEISKPLNFEMAATADMLRIALATKPHAVCLVPERREELTTEGGLDVVGQHNALAPFIAQLERRRDPGVAVHRRRPAPDRDGAQSCARR